MPKAQIGDDKDLVFVICELLNMNGLCMKDMSQLLLLGKFQYGGGPIFKVVLEC